jgi:hypothetical protein
MDNSNLRRIREVNWAEIEAEETRLLREMTVEQSVREFLRIQATLEPQFQATEALFRPEREEHWIALQARLARLEEVMQKPVETLVESMVQLQERLESAGISSILIGGLAVAVWGEPRGTRDIDFKVLLRREEAQKLLDALGNDFVPLRPGGDPLRALQGNGMVFVQDQSGTRIDLALADTDFDESAIGRGRLIELQPGRAGRVCSAEDLIVYKLLSLRPRDNDDALSIVKRQQDALDDAYILRWLKEFERAVDDSDLVQNYQQMRQQKGRKRLG